MKKSFSLISLLIAAASTAVFFGCTAESVEVDGTGTIEVREVDLAATQSATLVSVEVEEGDVVRPDQLVARTDDEIPQRTLRQAESKHTQALSQLELLQAGAHPKDIESAEAQVAQANEQFELARKEWDRIKT